MIDPKNIVKKYDWKELEELAIFSILVAGKTAKTVAKQVNNIKTATSNMNLTLFEWIQSSNESVILNTLWSNGVGCYKVKSKALLDMVSKFPTGKHLRKATVEQLEDVYGIGPKTARFFVMCHKGGNYAALDTHILKYLNSKGIEAPLTTPKGKKYLELEQEFLKLVPSNMTPAEFDLEIWKQYARN